MAVFLFWNLNGKEMTLPIQLLVNEHDIDVLLLAENSISPPELLRALNPSGNVRYEFAPSIGCDRIHVFCRFPSDWVTIIRESSYLTIRHLTFDAGQTLLLAGVHFPSKVNWDDES